MPLVSSCSWAPACRTSSPAGTASVSEWRADVTTLRLILYCICSVLSKSSLPFQDCDDSSDEKNCQMVSFDKEKYLKNKPPPSSPGVQKLPISVRYLRLRILPKNRIVPKFHLYACPSVTDVTCQLFSIPWPLWPPPLPWPLWSTSLLNHSNQELFCTKTIDWNNNL